MLLPGIGAWLIGNVGSADDEGSGGTDMIGMQVFTASGTYTPTSGTTKCLVVCTAGGGAGGGVDLPSASGVTMACGGGAGATTVHFCDVADINAASVTIGAGGVGSSSATGGDGGDSSVGAVVVAKGGSGAVMRTSDGTMDGITGGGGDGSLGTGDLALSGGNGMPGSAIENHTSCGGPGGCSYWGTSGQSTPIAGGQVRAGTDAPATAYGAGGGGAAAQDDGTAAKGGDGADGLVVIYEFG